MLKEIMMNRFSILMDVLCVARFGAAIMANTMLQVTLANALFRCEHHGKIRKMKHLELTPEKVLCCKGSSRCRNISTKCSMDDITDKVDAPSLDGSPPSLLVSQPPATSNEISASPISVPPECQIDLPFAAVDMEAPARANRACGTPDGECRCQDIFQNKSSPRSQGYLETGSQIITNDSCKALHMGKLMDLCVKDALRTSRSRQAKSGIY
eukprot:gnl/MRDRNA2_/MRDRNA2_16693_c0_seq1.p1 gnl/MRDRNA2_/MRDRNA2_16693_c0~~gnl/MRDRNA2_/MRDRNA2_16693_c0_seq1.p1  ORF type:complete len:211 (-),score=28.19 gnl/MRDRNA2_/MRDRNA2_16693_c0_seq1:29-661(-)